MTNVANRTEAELTRALTYAGFVLVAFETVKSLIVNPIKAFYLDTPVGEGMPFKSYEEDVLSRHDNQFEASLLYLCDFMEAIDSEDVLTIQALRKHRNDLAHDLPNMLSKLDIEHHLPLLERTGKVLFKLSNHQTNIQIGSEPRFRKKGIDWNTIKGPEYVLFEQVLNKVRLLQSNSK